MFLNKNLVLLTQTELIQLLEEVVERRNTTLISAVVEAFTNASSPRYVSRKKAREITGLSDPTLWKLDKTGILSASRVGSKLLYKVSDIEQYLDSKKEEVL